MRWGVTSGGGRPWQHTCPAGGRAQSPAAPYTSCPPPPHLQLLEHHLGGGGVLPQVEGGEVGPDPGAVLHQLALHGEEGEGAEGGRLAVDGRRQGSQLPDADDAEAAGMLQGGSGDGGGGVTMPKRVAAGMVGGRL